MYIGIPMYLHVLRFVDEILKIYVIKMLCIVALKFTEFLALFPIILNDNLHITELQTHTATREYLKIIKYTGSPT